MNYRPYVLLAELVYECPLRCPYCSNPTRYPHGEELTAAEWAHAFQQAYQLGVLHVGLSGGEPLQRADLTDIIQATRSAGLYSNLITSAVGLNKDRLASLVLAGLDSIQISFQAAESELGDEIAGARVHALKLQAAREVRRQGLPLTLNVVLHRRNIETLPEIIRLAEELDCTRLELANVQFYGWAWKNRHSLLPTFAQVETAQKVALAEKERLHKRMEILYVFPDYYQDHPKPCMQGWGRRYLTINPVGQVLPCPTAFTIPNLPLENLRERGLAEIWNHSDSFNRFRGTDWMPEPCQSCPQREIDFGGCRCQASLLTGEARNTDPVCVYSPHHSLVTNLTSVLDQDAAWQIRQNPTTQSRSETGFGHE